LFRSVDELEFSVRSQNCLQNANLKYIGELVQKTESEMLKTKNFGRKSLNEIKEILGEMGLQLGMRLDHFPTREELDSRRQAKQKETA
jgi:DNA-directed RNA polymerase subunit alpha